MTTLSESKKFPFILRLLDIIISAFALTTAMPLMAFIALAVRLDVGVPIFFRQARLGLEGLPFTFVKFRTMTNACDPNGDLLDDDLRVTHLGRFLRKTSLDELPSLWLVLNGTMSMIGPRPLPVDYLPRMTADQRRRFNILPGISGLAQVNGRTSLGLEERLKLDIEYLERMSLIFYLSLLCKTIAVILSRSGADSHEAGPFPWFSERRNDKRH